MEEKVFDPLKYKSLKENAHDAAKKFLGIFGIDLDKSIEGIKSFIFGEDEDGNRTKGGFLGKFVNDFKETFKSFGNWIKGGFSDTAEWTGTKAVKNVSGQAKELANTIAGAINKENDKKNNKENTSTDEKSANVFEVIKDNVAKAQEKASGTKRVTKTGLAVISEGEMIIPPDMNPFNIAKRSRAEKQVKENIKNKIDDIIQFDGGTTSANFDNEPSKEEKSNQRILKFLSEQIKGKNSEEISKIMEDLKQKYPKTYPLFEKFIKENQGTYSRDDYEKGKEHIGYKIGDQILNATTAIVEPIKKSIEENFTVSEEDKEKFKKNAFDFIGDIKEHGGTLAAGATIGAGVSLLTGLVGGPLLGAAVGAGTALITKSKTVQNMLFGNEEEGKQGLLPENLTKAIKKYLPDMGLGGAMGGILSLIPGIPGGPIAGMIIGSAIGFAKNSEAVQKYIFGDDIDGFGLDKDEFQKKVQRVLPKMGAGALAGLIAGPFGSIGANILLGSALGFASDTEAFKDIMFGEEIDGKRSGGIFGSIAEPMVDFFKKSFDEFKKFLKDDILNPVKNAIPPLIKDIKLLTSRIGDFITDFFREKIGRPIENLVKDFIVTPIGKFVSNAVKMLVKPIKAIVSSPFKLFGALGESRRKSHIKHGNAEYMGAEQRNAFRKSKGKAGMFGMGLKDEFEEFDQGLSNISNEDLEVIRTAFSATEDATQSAQKTSDDAYKRIKKQVYSFGNNVQPHIAKAALDMVRKGQYPEAIKFVQEAKIDEPARVKIIATLNKEMTRMKIAKGLRDNSIESTAQIAELANKLGMKVDIEKLRTNRSYRKKILRNLNGEAKYREAYKKDPVQELNNDEQKRHGEVIDIITQIRDKM
jgi:hypothetical protein